MQNMQFQWRAWTAEKPTIEGWYWYKLSWAEYLKECEIATENIICQVVKVDLANGNSFLMALGSVRHFLISEMAGQWSGPISTPLPLLPPQSPLFQG